MTKYSGSGWHKQSLRHSRARRTGHAGGKYLTRAEVLQKMNRQQNKNNLFFNISKKDLNKEFSKQKKHYGVIEETPAEIYKGITLWKHQRVRQDGRTIYSVQYSFKKTKYPKGEAFYSEKDRDERIKELKETQDYIQEEKQKKTKAQEFTRADVPFKEGDTFETSWGYDQTNYDFIVIKSISPTGKTAICQRARLSQNKPEGQMLLQRPSSEGYGDTFKMKIKRRPEGDYYLVGTYADGQGHYDGHWRRDTFQKTDPNTDYAETSPEFGH